MLVLILFRYLQTSIANAALWAKYDEPADGWICENWCVCCDDVPELPPAPIDGEPPPQNMHGPEYGGQGKDNLVSLKSDELRSVQSVGTKITETAFEGIKG